MAAERQREFLVSDPERDAIAQSRREMAADLAERFDRETLTQLQVLLNTIELWDADVLGYSELASWQAMRDTLESMGFLDKGGGKLQDAFTNQFVAGRDE